MTQLQKESLDQTSVPYTKYLFIILALTGGVYLLAGPLQNFVTATVDIGVVQGFTCGSSQVQDADGNSYDTVLIGTQCWMASNLNVGTRVDVSTTQTDNATIEKWCYSDTDDNCDTNDHPNHPDGGLYQWDEAMQYSSTEGAQGICPSGWHIPTHDEFTTLERAVCTSGSCATDFPYDTTTIGSRGTDEGTKLKPNGSSGFELNLAGLASFGSFYSRSSYGDLWSSSPDGGNAWYRRVQSTGSTVERSKNTKNTGISIRCLKDDPFSDPSDPTVTIATTPVIDELEQGLVGHWTFDGPDVDWGSSTAEIKDRSGQGNHGDAQGGMSTRSVTPGKLGQGMSFNGVDDSVVVMQTSELMDVFMNDTDSSICAWFNSDYISASAANDRTIAGFHRIVGTSARFDIQGDYGSETIRFIGSNAWVGDLVETPDLDLTTNTWYHACVTNTLVDSASSTATIFVNGISVVTDFLDRDSFPDPTDTANVTLGQNGDTNDLSAFFDGDLDDVRIYNRALSADEVMRLYKLGEGVKIATTVKSPGSPLENGLVGHWTFDGPDVDWGSSTAEIKDASGNGNHGDAQGGMSTRSVTPGKLGQGMQFDGVDDSVFVDSDLLRNLSQFTVSLWSYVPQNFSPFFESIIGNGFGITPLVNGWALMHGNGVEGQLFLQVHYSTATLRLYSVPDSFAFGEWNHIVVSWGGTETIADSHMYVNGEEVSYSGSSQDGSGSHNFSPYEFIIGDHYAATGNYVGSLDDVRIYDRALSAQEVQMLYQLGR